MKCISIYNDYPDDIKNMTYQTVDGLTELVLSVETVLVNSAAENVLKIELKNNVGDVTETSTTIQLNLEDFNDVLEGLKLLSSTMNIE